MDKQALADQMTAALHVGSIPAVDFHSSHYIEDNVEGAATGVKGDSSVKVFGNSLAQALEKAWRMENAGIGAGHRRSRSAHGAGPANPARQHRSRPGGARRPGTGDMNVTVQAAMGGGSGNLYDTGGPTCDSSGI